jgi:hypothetical protein
MHEVMVSYTDSTLKIYSAEDVESFINEFYALPPTGIKKITCFIAYDYVFINTDNVTEIKIRKQN